MGQFFSTRWQRRGSLCAIVAALAFIVVPSGCSASGGSGGGSDADSIDALNPRVVSAVTPLSGSDTTAASWLVDQWVGLRTPAIKSCLGGVGKPDLLSKSLDHVRSSASAYHIGIGPYFRNLDSIAANGFYDSPVDPLNSMFDASADPIGRIVMKCTEQYAANGAGAVALKKSDRIRQRALELSTAWNKQIDIVTSSEAFSGTYGKFATCLQTKGVPADDVKDFRAFGTYLDGLVQRDGTEGAQVMQLAKNYAHCRAGYDNALSALLKDRRPKFLQDHLDQVTNLSALIGSS